MTQLFDPIPLALFEEYMLLDSRDAYPMEFFCLLQFKGTMNHDRFSEAVRTAVVRHPLLHAVVERSNSRNFRWVPSPKEPEIRFLHESDSGAYNESGFPETSRLDVFQEPGLRIYVIDKKDGHDVVLQFHHTTSDGMGASQFIRDLLLTYAILSGEGNGQLLEPVPDPNILTQRTRIGWTATSYIWNFRYNWASIGKFLFGNAKTLVPYPKEPDIEPEHHPSIVTRTLTKDETLLFAGSAKALGGTVNDALIDSAVRTAGSWQMSLPSAPERGIFRVAVPMNLRDSRHVNMPVGNVVTMVFLDFPYRNIARCESLLNNVHRQMESIKKHDQGRVLNGILEFGKYSASLLRRNLSVYLGMNRFGFSRCRATICLSNTGRPLEDWPLEKTTDHFLRVGGLVLHALVISPPIRPKTLVSYSATTYASRMHLSLRYDPFYISRGDAETLLEAHCNDLRQYGRSTRDE